MVVHGHWPHIFPWKSSWLPPLPLKLPSSHLRDTLIFSPERRIQGKIWATRDIQSCQLHFEEQGEIVLNSVSPVKANLSFPGPIVAWNRPREIYQGQRWLVSSIPFSFDQASANVTR
jgi:hypothetical protein